MKWSLNTNFQEPIKLLVFYFTTELTTISSAIWKEGGADSKAESFGSGVYFSADLKNIYILLLLFEFSTKT
jgi:hypothetical protein